MRNSPTYIMRLGGRVTLKGKELKTIKVIHGGQTSPSSTLISL